MPGSEGTRQEADGHGVSGGDPTPDVTSGSSTPAEADAAASGDGRSDQTLVRRAIAAADYGLRDPLVVLGGVLIIAALALKIYVLRSAYFVEDDFLFFGNAAATNLTPDYLTSLHKGHLMPGAMLLAYIQTAIAPYDWGLATGIMVAFQAGASAAVFRLLWVVFGRRWAILAPLAVYLFAPLTMPVLAWWAAALNAVPFQLAMALSLLWMVRYLRTGDVRYGWMTAGAVVLGMAFSVKALFLPPLLFVVAAAFLVRGRFPKVIATTLERDMPFWVGMGALSVGHGLLYISKQDTAQGEGAGLPKLDTAVSAARRLLGETFPAGTVGGPFEWGPVTPAGGLLNPSAPMVIGAWSVLAVVVGVSLLLRRRSWRAWAIVLGYLVVVDIIPTLIARGRYEDAIGFDPRYVADAALVFAICLAFAYIPTREESPGTDDPGRGSHAGGTDGHAAFRWVPPPKRARDVTIAATTVFILAAGYSTYAFADTLSGNRVRWYLDTVRAQMSEIPKEAGVYPRPVPADIVLPWNGPRGLSSYVLSPLADEGVAERLRSPGPSDTALVFNDAGYLVPAKPKDDSAFFGKPDDDKCMSTLEGEVMWQVESFGGPTMILAINYTAETSTRIGVVLGDSWIDTELPAAPKGGMWYVPVPGAGSKLLLHTKQDELCMKWVTFGELEPQTDGDPWAQQDADEDDGDGEKGTKDTKADEKDEDGGKKDTAGGSGDD
ncbi:hypothetical protein CDO52_23835 [Nocardiopsis gilva YIM 90087]|uniref:Glycosyltransferase RgtA/B/C/D-like domain-containing protein n=1 Tax=Nocardiopsis gilva YIM 90087 TaxID=1235441 RepID=A0A223SBG5_9ACTN|nr:hypothetical protein [Nocardiopsis gilva]ASU85426.1 hypothetical protein CDO52_23835 [Nocardiopsis gilva YIM 90087]